MGGGSANETAGEGSRGKRRGFGRDAAVILRRLLLCLGGYTAAAAAAAPLWGIISTTHAKGNGSKEGEKKKRRLNRPAADGCMDISRIIHFILKAGSRSIQLH